MKDCDNVIKEAQQLQTEIVFLKNQGGSTRKSCSEAIPTNKHTKNNIAEAKQCTI